MSSSAGRSDPILLRKNKKKEEPGIPGGRGQRWPKQDSDREQESPEIERK